MTKKLDHIIEFYGETCPHCISMRPVIQQLETELGVEITKLEVWNDADNAEIMKKYEDIIGEACGGYAGVPAFVNTQTNQALCGAQEPDMLKLFIEGADCSHGVCMPHTPASEKPAK